MDEDAGEWPARELAPEEATARREDDRWRHRPRKAVHDSPLVKVNETGSLRCFRPRGSGSGVERPREVWCSKMEKSVFAEKVEGSIVKTFYQEV